MKIRNGFVSNSSSSSFIVSAPKGKSPRVVIEAELPSDEEITNQKELDEYFTTNYGDGQQTITELLEGDEGEYYRDDYNACLKELKKGRVIHFGTVCSDGDDALSNMLYQTGLSGYRIKDGIIIQDCSG